MASAGDLNASDRRPSQAGSGLSDSAGPDGAATTDWSKVNPAIFGTIFQQNMDETERHAYGAHFTSETDILRIVTPTISRPWRERIAKASTMKELLGLRSHLTKLSG